VTAATGVRPADRLALGIVLIAMGLALALEQAGLLGFEGVGRLWPLALVLIGIVKARQPLEEGQRAVGVALILLGGFFQAMSVLSWGRAWPLLLVGVGGFLLWQAIAGPRRPGPGRPASPFVAEVGLLGVSKRPISVPDLRGGYVTAVMGGVELDLRQSGIVTSPAVLDVAAFWGGIEIRVPAEWCVESNVVPFMGGFEDKTHTPRGSAGGPRLVVRGYVIMGGAEIRN